MIAGVLALVLAACGGIAPGGDPTQVTDPQSAAAFLPALDGYTVTGADSISDAIAAAAGEGVDQFGNPMLEQVVTRIDNFIQCYEDVGAVSANIYTQVDLTQTITDGSLPAAGAVAVVNQDRVRENLLACITGGGEAGAFSAQSVSVCQGSGSFESGGDTFTYVYVGTQESFCAAVNSHFSGF
jgi:hypothetical protein